MAGFKWSMRRVLLEWGGISSAFLAAACLLYWCISLFSNHSVFLVFPLGGPNSFQMSVANGQVTFARFLDNVELIEDASVSGALNRGLPPVTRKVGWNIPGLTFRYLRFSEGWSHWYLRLSLLMPVLLFALFAAYCLYRLHSYRLSVRDNATAKTSPTISTE